jgi:hypothetical protein
MDLIRPGINLTHTPQLPTIGNINMAAEQTSKVGSTLAPLALGTYANVQLYIFGKYTPLKE